ncbi:signal peptidase I [Pseudothauera nasutitermitis]|nr:signal peptidase I [Pseudothauera nasutitermitis]
MPNPPRKWIAALLGVLAQPLSMLYVGQARWAGIYFLLSLAIVFTGELYLRGSGVDGMLALILAAVCAIHAYRAAANYPKDRSRPAYSRWYGLLGALCTLLLLVLVLRAYLFEPFRAASGSMQPAIPIQAYLIVQKWGYGHYGAYGIRLPGPAASAPLKRGDVVVFEFPADRSIQYVKRLVGLPGDTVAYQDKELTINGTPISHQRVADHLDMRTATRIPAYRESLDGTEYTVLIREDTPPAFAALRQTFPFQGQCAYTAQGITCRIPDGHYFMLGDNRDASYDSRVFGFVPADHIVGKVVRIVP